MARKTFKIPSRGNNDEFQTQEEKFDDVLASLNSIQTKQEASAPKVSSSRVPILPIVFGTTIIAIIIVALIGIGGFSFSNSRIDSETAIISESLNFPIELLNGTTVYLSNYSGNPIIIDFMATWCNPCKDQLEDLKLVKSSHPDVIIISITVDLVSDSLEKLNNYVIINGMTWIVGRDINQKGAQIYNVVFIPTIAFINSAGKLKGQGVGPQTYETLVSWINQG
ncbi:TlpA family protein disulfide reductase [Candidatus Hodarchaeum mangrovi]